MTLENRLIYIPVTLLLGLSFDKFYKGMKIYMNFVFFRNFCIFTLSKRFEPMKHSVYFLMFVTTLTSCGIQQTSLEPSFQRPQPTILEENGETTSWIYNEQISDEFEAPFDTVKWFDCNPVWIGREPSLFRTTNVRTEGGQLILSGKREDVAEAPEGYHTFTSAAVQSKTKVLYGFFEIACKPMDSALSSAFWLYTNDSIKQEEIDIFEICGRNDAQPSYEKKYFATSHYLLFKNNIQISDHVEYLTEGRWADQWITAGFKWTRKELVWYVNGKEIRRRANDFWHSPETINFDSEAFPGWWGLPSETDNGGEFRIKYFRYWTEKDTPSLQSIYINDMKKK